MKMNDDGGFEILDHPADLGIEAWGTTVSDAFRNAARGLVSVIVDPATIEPITACEVHLDAVDRDQLLVKWLEEILYLYDARGFVPCGIEMKRFTGTQLTAALSGEQISTTKHATRIDVKAITYHQLEIKENEGGVRVRVFVDI